DDCAEGDVHRLANPNGNEDLPFGIVIESKVLYQAFGNGFAQLEQAEIGSVTGLATLERVNGRLPDVPGRNKVRLAYPQRDDILHALDDVEKVANARARNGADIGGDKLLRLEGRRHDSHKTNKMKGSLQGGKFSHSLFASCRRPCYSK